MGRIDVLVKLHSFKQKKLVTHRRLGAAQRLVQTSRPPVSANDVARHLAQVATAPKDRVNDKNVRDGWRQFLRSLASSAPRLHLLQKTSPVS